MVKIYKKVRKIGAIIIYWGYDIIRFSKYLNYSNRNGSLDEMKGTLILQILILFLALLILFQ